MKVNLQRDKQYRHKNCYFKENRGVYFANHN